MLDFLLASASAPTLHPLVVHFPIALLLTATLFDVGCLIVRERRWLDPAATVLYILGTAGAGAAWLTGRQAARSVGTVSGAAQSTMADHESLGLITLLAFLAVTALRLLVAHLSRHDLRIRIGFFRVLALVAALFAQVALVVAAEHGGSLVYGHGVGVQAIEAPVAGD